MLHEFLDTHREELIERCRGKVLRRTPTRPFPLKAEHGVPLFLAQLIDTLRGEDGSDGAPHPRHPGKSSPKMAVDAAKHGDELFWRGYTVDQVIHDYGDLCQAITELATERREPVGANEFRTLNGCLDDAIADAVTEFGRQRDLLVLDAGDRAMSERLGFLANELRNCLNTAMLSFAAIEGGRVGLRGATAQVLKGSLACLRDLIDRPFVDARLAASAVPSLELTGVERFVEDIRLTADMDAKARGCEFSIDPVAPDLAVKVDKQMLYSTLSNLLQNAFKFTRLGGQVNLKAYGKGERVVIEVRDECDGLSPAVADALGKPYEPGPHGSGSQGMGITIARRALEAMGGTLRARNLGGGCMFSIDLPRYPR
jgi:signal transduction histidine kinase